MTLRILEAGAMVSVQDTGRIGLASLGVGRAGPMDGVAARLANALVGNPADAALIEICLRGPTLRFDATHVIAITGARVEVGIGGNTLDGWRTLRVGVGDELKFGGMRQGAFAYLAIAGGLAVPRALGSAATDLNARIGPYGGRALRAGDCLEVAAAANAIDHGAHWSLDPEPWFDASRDAAVHAIRGTHFDALGAEARGALFDARFRVGAQSNRVGYRLEGHALRLDAALDLVSEPAARGTVQLPPGGTPIALMAEHPTIGGYPRIAQIAAIDWPRFAQRRIGTKMSLREITLDDAQSRYLRRERELARLIEAIEQRLAE